jgi:hypothetical protein
MLKNKNYSGLEVSLATGSKLKKMLSNKLTLRVPGDRSDVRLNLTIRQARALRKFLNDNNV